MIFSMTKKQTSSISVFVIKETMYVSPRSLGNRRSSTDESTEILLDKSKYRYENLDVIEATVGNIGLWQVQIYVSMFIIVIPSAWVRLGIELFAHKTDFWCKSSNFTQTNHPNETCQILSTTNNPCLDGFDYDLSITGTTIISEWDLVCNREYLITIIQIVKMIGAVLGALLFGMAADRYGRRDILLISTFMRFICGVLSSVPRSVAELGIISFLLAFFDGAIPFITLTMIVEVLGGKWKIFLATIQELAISLGFPIMGLITNTTKNWRYTQIGLFSFSILTTLCAWLVPESPKWLLSVDKKVEAISLLEDAAKKNNKNASAVRHVVWELHDKKTKNVDTHHWFYLFQTPELRQQTFLSIINGIILFTIINGYLQYFGEFSNNPFSDLNVQGVSTSVGVVIAAVFVTIYCQKHFLVLIFILVAVCSCLSVVATSANSVWSTITLVCLGAAASGSEPIIERLYPTPTKNSFFWIFKLSDEIGTIFAPVIVYLNVYQWYLPTTIIFILSLAQIVFLLLLPKTSNKILPETNINTENIELR